MKFLVIIVSIIVVHTVDGRNSPDNYGGLGYGPGETENHNSVEIETNPTFSIQDPYSGNHAHQFYSNQTGHVIPQNSGKRCYANNICNRKGGSCVTNAKLCRGRQVPGCKGKNCQCCVPGNRCYTNNICKRKGGSCVSNAKLCRGRLVPGCKGKNCQCCVPGCPVDFFHTEGSSQCYKYYKDKPRSWTEAKGMCESEGLILAEPADPITLRKYLVQTYGYNDVFLGARGTGSNYRWDNSGREISNTDAAWRCGHPGTAVQTRHCLLLLADKSNMDRYPYQPYAAASCTGRGYTLCEYL